MFDGIKNNIRNALKGFNFGGYGGQAGGYNDPYGFNYRSLAGASYDYRREVGATWENSAVMACVSWAVRTFPEAQLKLQEKKNGKWEEVEQHLVLDLLSSPNPDYPNSALWSGIVTSWMLDGNAYLYLERGGPRKGGEVGWPTGMYYMPHFQVNPRFEENGSTYISDYIYRTGRTEVILAKDNVLQIRNGLSLDNTRKGTCPLLSVLREICADNEASTAAAAIMRNLGIPGLTFAPSDPNVELSVEQRQKMREMGREKFTGDRRGELFMSPIPGKFETFGFSPEQLVFDKIRRVPEERICGVLGIPAIVAGLGAGLDRSTFANYAEAREAAYESCLIPMYRVMAEQLSWNLLPAFNESPAEMRFHFDTSGIQALQEDQNALHQRVRDDWEKGIIKRNEARIEIGFNYDEDKAQYELDNIYYQDLATIKETINSDNDEDLPK